MMPLKSPKNEKVKTAVAGPSRRPWIGGSSRSATPLKDHRRGGTFQKSKTPGYWNDDL